MKVVDVEHARLRTARARLVLVDGSLAVDTLLPGITLLPTLLEIVKGGDGFDGESSDGTGTTAKGKALLAQDVPLPRLRVGWHSAIVERIVPREQVHAVRSILR